MEQPLNLIVMGGAWGGLQTSLLVLAGLPAAYPIPIILVLHRLKKVKTHLHGRIYSLKKRQNLLLSLP